MGDVLVVEDLEYWKDIAESNLNSLGVENVQYACSAQEGLELYQKHRPSLVLTDINFDSDDPGNVEKMTGNLDGLSLCSVIRSLSKDAIIVVMSQIEDVKDMALDMGADYFIPKKRFKEEIGEVINQWRLKEQ